MIKIRKATFQDIATLKELALNLVPNSFKGVLNTSQIHFMLDKYYSQ